MKIRYGKQILDISANDETTIDSLVESIKLMTDCSEIKLISAGKTISTGLNQTVANLPNGLNTKISVIGSQKSDIELLSTCQPCYEMKRVINDLASNSVPHAKKVTSTMNTSVIPKSKSGYGFNLIQTLPGFSDESKARDILYGLSSDIGILAVMEKHKFNVGQLCELYPEGYVGVDDVCVLGLNENKGSRILLRLRTDDLEGFRKIDVIKKTLYHELAHNAHSEHDGNFYMLMREIEKDANNLDWRKSKSRSISSSSSSYAPLQSSGYSPESKTTNDDTNNGVYRLGGVSAITQLNSVLPPNMVAGMAALMRNNNNNTNTGSILENTNNNAEGDKSSESHDQSRS